MMMGNKEVIPPRPKVDLLKENLAKIVYEDNNSLKMVHVADYVFDGLCAPSQDALVVKLLGKNIGFHAMKDRLSRPLMREKQPLNSMGIVNMGVDIDAVTNANIMRNNDTVTGMIIANDEVDQPHGD
ncbi:hypothetical protein JHK87_033099 [Glycine soja]|nr:hypothetical protein JHK87_033099 [Glycine soja]